MKNRTFKKLLVTFSIILAAGFGIVWACADDGSWGFGYSDFAPEPFVEKSYKPLLYEPFDMFYDIRYDDVHITRFNDEILNDWAGFLKGKLSRQQTEYFLLNDSSTESVNGIYQYITKNIKTPAYNEWSTKINLADNDVKAFLEFMYFARKIEETSVFAFDYWDYENVQQPKRVDEALIAQILKKYETGTNPFLKNRYWFQIIKAYFYSNTPENTASFFEKTKNDVAKNTLYYRAIAYMAGVQYKAKNYAKSNYLNSIVFNQCLPLRVTAIYNFHPQNETDWNEALKLAQSDDEKAALWAMLGYYSDPLRTIGEIYKLNPKNQHLDYLLTRLINIHERKLAEIALNDISKYKKEISEDTDKNILSLLDKIAQAENTNKPYLWNMAAGYMQMFAGNYAQARDFFAKSEKTLPQTADVKNQLRLLRFVNMLSELSAIDKNAENKILPELTWIYKDLPGSNNGALRYEKATFWSKKYLSLLYAAQNNKIFAELYNPESEFYYNDANIEAMKTFLEKSDKTAYEQLAVSQYYVKPADIYAYQAVINTYKNKIDDALAYMAKADKIKDENLYGNPFNGNIIDCHDCDHAATQKTKFSKYRLIEVIQIMQNKIKNGEDLYNNYLLLGNAFYNITHYGNARFFYEGKLITGGCDPWMLDKHHKNMLIDMTLAKQYYQKAYDVAANDEQKAKCAYMLAKCERNEYYNKNIYLSDDYIDYSGPDFLAWNGFKLLKTQYSATKFYKDAIRECDYFSQYAKK